MPYVLLVLIETLCCIGVDVLCCVGRKVCAVGNMHAGKLWRNSVYGVLYWYRYGSIGSVVSYIGGGGENDINGE